MEDEELRRLAEEWLTEIFENGFGDQADRLELKQNAGGREIGLGGWGREPMRQKALAFARRVAEEARRQERLACSGHWLQVATGRCAECGERWPCLTARRIKGER